MLERERRERKRSRERGLGKEERVISIQRPRSQREWLENDGNVALRPSRGKRFLSFNGRKRR